MADKVQTVSFLETLRKNRAGALLTGLIVTVAVALILSAAVPDDINSMIAILLIVLLALAIGFAVKVTSPKQDVPMVFTAGGLAAIGVPILFGAGTHGIAFDDAILYALGDEYLSVGSALAAIVAITVAVWGPRSK
ncbi:MAG: hypothetical protein JW722_03030 [Demequinaceae bacterium]|nr:hypothetical protein [Demequinaceae bacterium]